MAVTSRRRKTLRRREVEPHDARAARVAALDALGRRDHASGELRAKLQAKGYEPALVDRLIEELRTERLVDDRRFVANFIAYHAQRGQGPLRVRAQLGQLGMRGELVELELDAYPTWLDQLRAVRRKKFGETPPTSFTERQRQARFLGYRGFTGAQIRTALGFDTDLEIES